MPETKDRIGEIKDRLVKTENGVEHQMTDPETGKSASVMFTMEQLMTLIKEIRKPDDETLRKKEEEEARRQESMRQMIVLANAEIEARENSFANCARTGHKKERGETAIHGQVFSDGNYRGICLHCQWVTPPQKITPAMMAGMGL